MTLLLMQFIGLAAIIAVAGTVLARSADTIAEITQLGRLLVGSLLVAAATSLPELTVSVAAVRDGLPDLAVGDLLGACLINLLALAGLDLFHRNGGKMLSREAASHALSATLGITLTALAAIGILTGPHLQPISFLGLGTVSWLLLVAYVLGARMVFINQRIAARAARDENPDAAHPAPRRSGEMLAELRKPALIFLAAAAVLFLVGPRLAHVAGELAEQSGLGKTFVGTTLLAACTTLPELVTALAAIRIGAYDLVIGNVFGSNAFNVLLLVPLDVAHQGILLRDVSPMHAITALATIIATAIALLGQLYRVERRIRLIEPDALLVVIAVLSAMYVIYQLSHALGH